MVIETVATGPWQFGRLDSNLDADGLGDPLALPRGPWSEVNQESGSSCRPLWAETSPDRHPEARRVDPADTHPFSGDQATSLHISALRPVRPATRRPPLILRLPLHPNSPFPFPISEPPAKMSRIVSVDHYSGYRTQHPNGQEPPHPRRFSRTLSSRSRMDRRLAHLRR